MAVITTGLNPKALWPGVKAWFGKTYDEFETQYTDLFETESSDKAYEEVVESVGFGLAVVKPQGSAISYDADHQGSVNRFTHVGYGLGFIITHEELKDNLYMDVAKRRSPDLAFSMRQTKENVGANVYNRAFDTNYTFGDGKAMCVTDHPSDIGSQSNRLTTDADLSEASLEDMCIQISNATDSRGRKISLKPRSLHIPTASQFEAYRILKSINQNDTANNAINALRSSGAFPKGIKVNNYFTDSDAWFVRTQQRWSVLMFERDPMVFASDNDFDTKNLKYAAYERYSVGSADFRGVFGTQGA
jgi:hypothetical protein